MYCSSMALKVLLPALLLMGLAGSYVDPGGAFACTVPQGWSAAKTELGDGLFLTEVTDSDDEKAANVTLFVQNSPSDIDASQHGGIHDAFVGFLTQVLGEDGTIRSQKRSEVTFDGRKAARVDMTYTDEDGVSLAGRITVVVGKRNAVAVIASWRTGDAKGLKLATEVESSVAIESRTPRSGGSSGSGLFSQASIAGAAQQMKGNFKRQPMGAVIVKGEPPLTYGSVANFVTVIEVLFDIQFTETEFLATQERFVEFYSKADAEGKRILANQGAELLKTLTTGTQEERDQSRAEGKAVFENAFRNGAEMGIGYAQVMWDAITRRANQMGTTTAKPAKDGWDQQISEGDIDATMEMLIFMWVASGRPTDEVTSEAVMTIRSGIIQGLPGFDPQLQMLIANAPKIYAGIRQQWAGASAQQRLAMAQQFEAALTEWGIGGGGGGGFEQSGGGGGGDGEYGMNAQIAMNTAWNSAKTWSTTSGG